MKTIMSLFTSLIIAVCLIFTVPGLFGHDAKANVVPIIDGGGGEQCYLVINTDGDRVWASCEPDGDPEEPCDSNAGSCDSNY